MAGLEGESGLGLHQVEKLPDRIEVLLDIVVYDAQCRYPLLDVMESLTLAKALRTVSDYRRRFPRALEDSPSGPLLEKQKKVDAFLLQFRSKRDTQATNGAQHRE